MSYPIYTAHGLIVGWQNFVYITIPTFRKVQQLIADVSTTFGTDVNVILDLLGRTAFILRMLTSQNKKSCHVKNKTFSIS